MFKLELWFWPDQDMICYYKGRLCSYLWSENDVPFCLITPDAGEILYWQGSRKTTHPLNITHMNSPFYRCGFLILIIVICYISSTYIFSTRRNLLVFRKSTCSIFLISDMFDWQSASLEKQLLITINNYYPSHDNHWSSPWSDVQSVVVGMDRGTGLVEEVEGVGVVRRPGGRATTTTTTAKRILLSLGFTL